MDECLLLYTIVADTDDGVATRHTCSFMLSHYTTAFSFIIREHEATSGPMSCAGCINMRHH
jgi:hypothetical protein